MTTTINKVILCGNNGWSKSKAKLCSVDSWTSDLNFLKQWIELTINLLWFHIDTLCKQISLAFSWENMIFLMKHYILFIIQSKILKKRLHTWKYSFILFEKWILVWTVLTAVVSIGSRSLFLQIEIFPWAFEMCHHVCSFCSWFSYFLNYSVKLVFLSFLKQKLCFLSMLRLS